EEPLSLPAEEGYGYYPSVVVGHLLNRYKIVCKLGWACSSSVWLCVDTATPCKTYVAVKILSAHVTGCIVGGLSAEYDIFRHIDPAGGHLCFAMDVLGPNMMALWSTKPNQIFSVSITKHIIKQILYGVDYLHCECGYIHTDIKADNVLTILPEPIIPKIDKHLEEHQPATYDNIKLSVKSQPLSDFNLDLHQLMVKLIDYSEATPINKHLNEHCQAAIVHAPEVTLGYPRSTPVNIWSVGCLVFKLVTNFHLFSQPGPYSVDVNLQNMAEYLEPFPPQLLEACSCRAEYFNENVTDFMPSSLEDILYGLGTMQVDDIPGVAVFIRWCLALDPTLHPSTLELLNDVWLEHL
ncbi:hypothetical protein PILCRDRAFT_81670, partial [Piloderma croceum F 1598]